jgi:hypothetical protein
MPEGVQPSTYISTGYSVKQNGRNRPQELENSNFHDSKLGIKDKSFSSKKLHTQVVPPVGLSSHPQDPSPTENLENCKTSQNQNFLNYSQDLGNRGHRPTKTQKAEMAIYTHNDSDSTKKEVGRRMRRMRKIRICKNNDIYGVKRAKNRSYIVTRFVNRSVPRHIGKRKFKGENNKSMIGVVKDNNAGVILAMSRRGMYEPT